MDLSKQSEGRLRAVYTVSELAAMAGVSRHRMNRLLVEAGVLKYRGSRRARTVCLSQLKRGFPDLWDSIVLKLGAETQE